MTPYATRDDNLRLNEPKDWDEAFYGPCNPLSVKVDFAEGTITSHWRPTLSERLRLIFGGVVRMALPGTTRHPPLRLEAVPRPAPPVVVTFPPVP